MKHLIAITASLMFCFSSFAEDVKELTPEQIEQILEEARKNGFGAERPNIIALDVENPMLITTDGFEKLSDSGVWCTQSDTHGDVISTDIPLTDAGEIDQDSLPDNCSVMHKLVARETSVASATKTSAVTVR